MEILRSGDSGAIVQILQLGLSRAGIDPGPMDGVLGTETQNALRAFQRQWGILPSGVVGPRTWQALHPYLTGYLVHTAVRGDTLYRLARRYNTPLSAVLTANPQIDPERMMIGQEVVIPLGFPVVPTDIAYSSDLLELVLEGLMARYPFLQTQVAGQSLLGRPLHLVAIGQGPREVFYNAAHHANEWLTTPVLLQFLEEYAQAYSQGGRIGGADAAQLYRETTLYLMPMVNPDGVDLVTGALSPRSSAYRGAQTVAQSFPNIPFPDGWKANMAGVDLNLNYPAQWEMAQEIKAAQGFNRPAPRDYPGPSPLSEPESRAVYQLTLDHNFSLILAYHSQGELIYWKYLDYEPEGSLEIAREMGQVSGYLVEETPTASGYAGYKDWFIQTYNRPGYTIEIGRGTNPLPLEQYPQIYRDNLGILVVGLEAASWLPPV